MENCGAKKIAAFEHPETTSLVVLKHAAEEFRHAYILKKWIAKIDESACPDYKAENLLAPSASRQLLTRIDVDVCRLLMHEEKMSFAEAKWGAYLLVTYAIEVRADMLYGIYQQGLSEAQSKVNVKSIIAEEEGHLAEMTSMLQGFHPRWEALAEKACAIENRYFAEWIEAVATEVGVHAHEFSA
jgi:hypothetical protein